MGVASADSVVLPVRLLPSHPPVLQEGMLQSTSPALPWGRDSGANRCDQLVLPRNIELAKSVVKVLRHKAHELGLSLDGDGFVALQEVVRLRRLADANEEVIWNEVNLDKVRFDAKV